MTKIKKKRINLDAEEKKLLKTFEQGEWKTVKNLAKEKALAKKAASNYLRKDAHINIRLLSSDLERIKQLAAYEGMPYQTLISSILHKYASGHL